MIISFNQSRNPCRHRQTKTPVWSNMPGAVLKCSAFAFFQRCEQTLGSSASSPGSPDSLITVHCALDRFCERLIARRGNARGAYLCRRLDAALHLVLVHVDLFWRYHVVGCESARVCVTGCCAALDGLAAVHGDKRLDL